MVTVISDRFHKGITPGLEYVKSMYAQLDVSKLVTFQDAGYTYQLEVVTVNVDISFSLSVK